MYPAKSNVFSDYEGASAVASWIGMAGTTGSPSRSPESDIVRDLISWEVFPAGPLAIVIVTYVLSGHTTPSPATEVRFVAGDFDRVNAETEALAAR